MQRTALIFGFSLACAAACTAAAPTTLILPDQPSPGSTGGPPIVASDAGSAPDAASPADASSPNDRDAARPVAGGELGILSLNLHCLKTDGTSFATNAARFDAIAEAVEREGASVILAQELCVSVAENAGSLLLDALLARTGARWSIATAFAHRAWENTPDAADESVAIFSRVGLRDARELTHVAQGALRRVSLGATIESPVTTADGAVFSMRVYTLHLDHAAAAARGKQARELASFAMLETDDAALTLARGAGAVLMPIAIGGDFNARSGSDATRAMVDYGFQEISGSAASSRIDHVFVHRSTPLSKISSKILFTGGAAVSDHPGVLVRFGVGEPSPVRLTRIVANGVFSALMTVRGDRAPLTWQQGWPAFARASGAPGATLVTSELSPGPFGYKHLRADVDWALGPNLTGQAESNNAVTPAFP